MINREPRCVLRLAPVRRSSCSFFGARTHRVRNRECTGVARRRAALHANGIWAQRLCSRVHACTDAGRNIIAVIRWNWGSLTLTRALEAPTCVRVYRAKTYIRSRVISFRGFLEVSVSTLNDKWKYAVPRRK